MKQHVFIFSVNQLTRIKANLSLSSIKQTWKMHKTRFQNILSYAGARRLRIVTI